MSLPKPVGRQKDVVVLPHHGHRVVLGTAGSGKTTMAVLRSVYLSTPGTDHSGKTLLVTFNTTLATYLRYLRPDHARNLTIENYHKFARGFLASLGKFPDNCVCEKTLRLNLIEASLVNAQSSQSGDIRFQRPRDYFSERIKWLAQHGVHTRSGFENLPQVVQSMSGLDDVDLDAVLVVYRGYLQLRKQREYLYDWDDLATSVIEALRADDRSRLYRHVVIDEGQDFSPTMLRSLALAIPKDGSLTFFGDAAQQIYGHRVSWRTAGLSVKEAEIYKLQDNYRNTAQIARLAIAISEMPYYEGVADLVEPVTPSAAGPLPTVVALTSREKQLQFVAEQAIELAKHQSVAVFYRDYSDHDALAPLLPATSVKLDRNLSVWKPGAGLYHGTYYSGKGLEFDCVLLPFMSDDRFPGAVDRRAFGAAEARARCGKLLYVAVTRTRKRLILTYSGSLTELLPDGDGLFKVIDG